MQSYQSTVSMNTNVDTDVSESKSSNNNDNAKRNQLLFVFLVVVLVGSLVAVSSTGSHSSRSNRTMFMGETTSYTSHQGKFPTSAAIGEFRTRAEDRDGFIPLFQADFEHGTVRLTDAGKKYRLYQNIKFEPNPSGAQKNAQGSFMPDFSDTAQAAEYDPKNYVLGFFSAITIEAPNIELDLNEMTIEQTRTFYLMQRVYAHITLANSPFIENEGPADFGELTGAMGCIVRNGKLGLSSHHGIHGNGANGCKIEKMEIVDFEIAGIAQNDVEELEISHVVVGPPLRPFIQSPYFNARMLLEFFRRFITGEAMHKKIKFSGRPAVPAKEIFDRLERGLDLTFDFFVNGNEFARNDPDYDAEFEANGAQFGSSIYGIVINGKGPSVNGIGFSEPTSKKVKLDHVTVRGMSTDTREVVSVVEIRTEGEVSLGPTGEQVDVFRLSDYQEGSEQKIEELKYIGNLRSDALFALNEYCLHETVLSSTPFRISDMLRNWAIDGKPIKNQRYICNGDAQFHVIKGVFGVRIEGVADFELTNVDVADIENRGEYGSELCGTYTRSHPFTEQTIGYGGTAAYGISITKSSGTIENTRVSNVRSVRGVASGIVIWDRSTVSFKRDGNKGTRISDISALGDVLPATELGMAPPGPANDEERDRLPNRFPEVCGLDIRDSAILSGGESQSVESQCLTSRLVCYNSDLPKSPPIDPFGQRNPKCGTSSSNYSPERLLRSLKEGGVILDEYGAAEKSE